jgi:hypothetical protein
MGRFFLVFVCLVNSVCFAGIQNNEFTDTKSGFAISKPSDWEFVQTPKSYGLVLKDESVIHPNKNSLVIFTKAKPAGYFGVRPTVSAERLTLPPKTTALVWLTDEMNRQATHSKNYVPGSPATLTSFDDSVEGARSSYINSTVFEGRELNIYHVLYVVPSRGKFFLVHMNCNEELAKEYVGVFAKIAASIEAKK